MSTTMLAHKNCGGPIVLDASKSVKLVAPSIGFTADGIRSVMLDVSYQSGVIHPWWMCTKCQAEINCDNLSEILCLCHCCSTQHPIPEMSSKEGHLLLCEACRQKVETHIHGTHIEDVEDIVKFFGITKETKFIPLTDILSKDIPLE